MITAAFLAMIAATLLVGARIGMRLYGPRPGRDDLRADEWWRR